MDDIIRVFVFILLIFFAVYLVYVCVNYKINKKIIGGAKKLTKEILKNPSKKFIKSMEKLMGGYDHTKLFIDTFFKVLGKTHKPVETISDIKYKLPFMGTQDMIKKAGSGILKYGKHIGQRKLILNEIQILIKARKTGIKYCIYAGAAPGHKTHYLSLLFPSIKFILVDPNKFNLILPNGKYHRTAPHPDIVHLKSGYPTKSNETKQDYLKCVKSTDYKIYIIEDFMTINLSNKFKELNCLFISDIRSNIYNASFPADFDIYFNNSMMYNWIMILKPSLSMLKIRMPFGDDNITIPKDDYIHNEFKLSKKLGIDFLQNYKDLVVILPKGEFFIQAWAPQTSSELRLVIKKEDLGTKIKYDVTDIDNKMFYFNTIERWWVYHKNSNASKKLRFCHCNDCALENKIWLDYGYNKKEVHKAVINLGTVSNGRYLNKVHDYNIWSPLKESEINKKIKLYKGHKIKKRYKKQKGNTGQNVN